MLDDAIVMAMEELLVIAMAHAHGELVGLKCETERVCLDSMILSESPALQRHHTRYSISPSLLCDGIYLIASHPCLRWITRSQFRRVDGPAAQAVQTLVPMTQQPICEVLH